SDRDDTDTVISCLKEELAERLQMNGKLPDLEGHKPYIIMVTGVNGVGKTTSIGKLAHRFARDGKRVILGAADTFRAAASEQLEIWSRHAEVEIVRNKPGADPASVAFDTVAAAMSRNADIAIIDTAGRLHTKSNLMEELKKINRAINRNLPGAPNEVLLVIDATTGQNGLTQAKVFKKAVQVNGIILTKLDGTAKGGIVVAIQEQLQVPVRYIGVGEQIDDLQPFSAKDYVEALFS
ncbi:MAG: signal recognition particle-docking protein FtsY, partial [bacterium]